MLDLGDIGEQAIQDLRIRSKEVDELRKKVEELERKLAQQRVWQENADVKVHQLVEENAKLQGWLMKVRLEHSEANADFRFMLRHSKFLESELRRVKSHMRKRKRVREDAMMEDFTREDIISSSSNRSGSDGEIDCMYSVPVIIRTQSQRQCASACSRKQRSSRG
ncbi:hypothetical protein R1sor_016933 [Riccia sorocarpa]|uniref:Uncharacterized protein n=1 Tax=Riccia sorocarpa TaxID=122646 RepID=A0ABD3HKA7_9MARC